MIPKYVVGEIRLQTANSLIG